MLKTANVQLDNPDTFVDGVPHELFARLRRVAPVLWHDTQDGGGFWVLTKYADVITVSQDHETFSSAFLRRELHGHVLDTVDEVYG